MNRPRLSVCIPSYNFGRFIGETLDSILPQATEDVEVVVVDGASTDDTEEVVARRLRQWPCLSYHRLERKGGIDVDMALSVAFSRGSYCWLFSADDLMLEGALSRMLNEIKEGLDVYICGFTICTIDMAPHHKHPILDCGDMVFELSNDAERKQYFSLAQTTTAFFSYMSSLVIKRTRWDEAAAPPDPRWQCWDHVGRIFRMMEKGLKVKYLAGEYLKNRADNDSFMDRGIITRIGISVEGFSNLANVFFGQESHEAWNIRRVLKNEYTPRYLLFTKIKTMDLRPEEIRRLDALVAMLYRDDGLQDRIRHMAYKAAAMPLLRFLRIVSRNSRRMFR